MLSQRPFHPTQPMLGRVNESPGDLLRLSQVAVRVEVQRADLGDRQGVGVNEVVLRPLVLAGVAAGSLQWPHRRSCGLEAGPFSDKLNGSSDSLTLVVAKVPALGLRLAGAPKLIADVLAVLALGWGPTDADGLACSSFHDDGVVPVEWAGLKPGAGWNPVRQRKRMTRYRIELLGSAAQKQKHP